MSLPWIKVFPRIRRHLKTEKLADALGRKSGAHHFVVDLWLWAADECPSGDLSGVPDRIVARNAGWRGDPARFVAALRTAGFIDQDGHLHDWDEHQPAHVAAAATEAPGGESKAERRRRLDAARKAARRSGQRADTKRTDADTSGHDADMSASRSGHEADKVRTEAISGVPSARAEIEIKTKTDSVPIGTVRSAAEPAVANASPATDPEPPAEPTQPALALEPTGPTPAELARRERERGFREAGDRLRAVFRETHGDPKADFTKAGRAELRRRLVAGRTEAEIAEAIRTLAAGSPWMRSRTLDQAVSEAGIQAAHGATTGPPPRTSALAVNAGWDEFLPPEQRTGSHG